MFDRADFYDAELRRHNPHLLAALNIAPQDQILDVGCGAGETTRQAARLAFNGQVLGVDVSDALLDAARRRTAEDGLSNVDYQCADAQTCALPEGRFDLCLSRFGVMFFADPAAAFANIGRAMKPGGRAVFMVWGSRERNEWAAEIQAALAPLIGASRPAPAFSLADQTSTKRLLTCAGFDRITWRAVREPVFYGLDVDAALEAVVGLSLGTGHSCDDPDLAGLRGVLEKHLTGEGVVFNSEAWIVSARKAPQC